MPKTGGQPELQCSDRSLRDLFAEYERLIREFDVACDIILRGAHSGQRHVNDDCVRRLQTALRAERGS